MPSNSEKTTKKSRHSPDSDPSAFPLHPNEDSGERTFGDRRFAG